jgi:hypothetical protein
MIWCRVRCRSVASGGSVAIKRGTAELAHGFADLGLAVLDSADPVENPSSAQVSMTVSMSPASTATM